MAPQRPYRDMYADQWRYMEHIVEARWEFGGQRVFSGDRPDAPQDGVMVGKADPTQNQIAVAASSFGYNTTDKVLTVWAKTLSEEYLFAPAVDDRIIVLDEDTKEPVERWMIQSVQEVNFGSQFVCYCRLSPLTRNPANAAPEAI